MIKFLVSFLNKGEKQMIVHEMDASFRYPGDYNFFIQNVCCNILFIHLLAVHRRHVQPHSRRRP